jgi:hypothetical protein
MTDMTAMAEPYICTSETPWSPERGLPVKHTSVREVGEQENGYPGGDIVTYECRHCKKRWQSELPQ